MNNNERRNYYRITDKIALQYQLLDKAIHPKEQGFPFQHDQEVHSIADEIQTIESESQHLLRAISEDSSLIANYLKNIDKRIHLLSNMIGSLSSNNERLELIQADFSEGGISCLLPLSFAEQQYLALKITLFPSRSKIMLTGRVLEQYKIDDLYRCSIIFEEITEADRHILARHIDNFQPPPTAL